MALSRRYGDAFCVCNVAPAARPAPGRAAPGAALPSASLRAIGAVCPRRPAQLTESSPGPARES
jgi:hypothetical protein